MARHFSGMDSKPAVGRYVFDRHATKPPRYSTRSLSEADLAHEIATAPDGDWLDACLAEHDRRAAA